MSILHQRAPLRRRHPHLLGRYRLWPRTPSPPRPPPTSPAISSSADLSIPMRPGTYTITYAVTNVSGADTATVTRDGDDYSPYPRRRAYGGRDGCKAMARSSCNSTGRRELPTPCNPPPILVDWNFAASLHAAPLTAPSNTTIGPLTNSPALFLPASATPDLGAAVGNPPGHFGPRQQSRADRANKQTH